MKEFFQMAGAALLLLLGGKVEDPYVGGMADEEKNEWLDDNQ